MREHFDKLAVQHGVAKPKTSARFAAAEGRPRIVDVANISMIKKVRAQLIALGKKPDSYADGVLQQMYGAQAPQFYELAPWDKMASLISALTRQQERAGGMKY